MTHSSLFSGIGGFDLAAHWAGIPTLFAVEKEPFPQQVLKKRFPNTKIYGDIFEFDGKQYAGRVDIISGGFPCQPFSIAGKRAGVEDNRYLWGEMLRVVREVKPTWVIAENVRGLLTIENGETFETVCNDLEVSGYEVQSFIIPALTVGAPHKRDRLWIVANTDSSANKYFTGEIQRKTKEIEEKAREKNRQRMRGESGTGCSESSDSTANSESKRFSGGGNWDYSNHGKRFVYQKEQNHGHQIRSEVITSDNHNSANATSERHEGSLWRASNNSSLHNRGENWSEKWIEALARIYGMDDGLPGGMDGLEQRYKDRSRKDRIKACGNAIVPQVAYQIFRAIMEVES